MVEEADKLAAPLETLPPEEGGAHESNLPDPAVDHEDPAAAAAAMPPERPEPVEREPDVNPLHAAREERRSKRQAVVDAIRSRDSGEVAEGEEPPPVEIAAEPQKTAEQKPKIKIKVDHREIELTQEELVAAAQRDLAASNRLAELNTLKHQTAAELAEARRLRESLARGDSPAHQRTEPPAEPATRETPTEARDDRRKKLSEIARGLQFGDPEEGADALDSLFEMMPKSAHPEEIARQANEISQAEATRRKAGEVYAGAHPEIAADPVMTAATLSKLHEFAFHEMRKLGVPDEQLRPARESPQVAFDWYRQYRNRGYTLPDPNELGERASREVETKYNLRRAAPVQTPPPPNARTETVQAEKRALSQTQPRRVSAIARTPPAAPKKTVTDIVAEKRAQRHQTSL